MKVCDIFIFELTGCTVCPGSSDPFYMVTYYIKWVATSWTDGVWPINIEFKFVGKFWFRMNRNRNSDWYSVIILNYFALNSCSHELFNLENLDDFNCKTFI